VRLPSNYISQTDDDGALVWTIPVAVYIRAVTLRTRVPHTELMGGRISVFHAVLSTADLRIAWVSHPKFYSNAAK